MNKPNWESAPEWANWLAQDRDGQWFFWEMKPVGGAPDDFWMNDGDAIGRIHRASPLGCIDTPEWITTLEARP